MAAEEKSLYFQYQVEVTGETQHVVNVILPAYASDDIEISIFLEQNVGMMLEVVQCPLKYLNFFLP